MTPPPRSRQAAAERRAPGMSSRPMALPTRAAAAPEIPIGTMKERLARLIAIWCPPSASTPILPMSSATPTNRPSSIALSAPIGRPIRSSRRWRRRSTASAVKPCQYGARLRRDAKTQVGEHRPAADRGRVGRSRRAQRREPEMAEDEEPVARQVDQVADHDRHGGGADHVHGLERLAEGEEQEVGRRAPEDGPHVGRGVAEDRGGLAQQAKQLADVPEEGGQMGTARASASTIPRCRWAEIARSSPAPWACATRGSSAVRMPTPEHQEDDRGDVAQRAGRQRLRPRDGRA